MPNRLLAWLRRHPVLVDTALVPALLVPSVLFYAGVQRVASVCLLLPFVCRRRNPTAVFGVVSALCLAQTAVPGLGLPLWGDVAFPVALTAVVAYGDGRARWPSPAPTSC